MAYDSVLAERISDVVAGRPGVTVKKMFGGVCFLVDGKMFVGVATDELMVRCGPAQHAECLTKPGVRPMDFTGRPMLGYLFVGPDALRDDAALRAWVELAQTFAASLPDKPAKKKR